VGDTHFNRKSPSQKADIYRQQDRQTRILAERHCRSVGTTTPVNTIAAAAPAASTADAVASFFIS
jgi:hypothetical protein